MWNFRRLLLIAFCLLPLRVQAEEPEAMLDFLDRNCLDCHDDLNAEAGLDLYSLDYDPSDPQNALTWTTVFKRVEAGDMPPREKPRPDSEQMVAFLDQISGDLADAERTRYANNGRATVRRLNRLEYEHTLADLLDLPHLKIAEALPPEGSAHGFDKSAEALDFSHIHASKLMEVADLALRLAIAPSAERPESRVTRFEVRDPENLKSNVNGFYALLKQSRGMPLTGMEIDYSVRRKTGNFEVRDPGSAIDDAPFFDSFAIFQNGAFNLGLNIRNLQPHAPGYYTVRVNGFGVLNDHGSLAETDRIETAGLYSGDRTLGYIDLSPYEPTTGEITVWLDENDRIKPLVASSPHAKIVGATRTKAGTAMKKGNEVFRRFEAHGIAFRWFELEGPHYEEWPPPSHWRLFGELPLAEGQPVNVISEAPMRDARRLLRGFLEEALRRPVTPADMQLPMSVVAQKLNREESFLEAMIAGYRTVLISPEFLLFSAQQPGDLPDHAIAERLSYFLWNTSPDTRLRNFARQGRLTDPEILRNETNRLLRDPRSDRFVEHFVDKWLKLEDIALTEPDVELYPEYNPLLTDSALWETRAFLGELIKKDLSAAHLIHSDFAMVNQRLAELYGLPGVRGNEIRRVELPRNSVRGGFLTQAAVLKTTANGQVTSPVVRGDYVMTHFLGEPPPPPPPTVPAVEPDITGATTIREQLALHSSDASCAACHEKIDPPGFALEAFDVMGAFRNRYRSIEKGDLIEDLIVEGRPGKAREALPVDASGVFGEGESFRGIRDFKGILLGHEEEVARTLLEQLTIYATGAPVGFADREAIDAIMAELKPKRYGVRSMIHAIIASDLFLEK